LFALLEMVLRLSHQRRGDVELATVVLPRLEVEKTILVVEWKPRDVDRTVWYRLFIHWPPVTRSVVYQSHVFRLRGYVATQLQTCAGTVSKISTVIKVEVQVKVAYSC